MPGAGFAVTKAASRDQGQAVREPPVPPRCRAWGDWKQRQEADRIVITQLPSKEPT